ncbi:AraC family transcriptional regulator [Desertivirga arenae]|uniref:AraC family transcriptional regulator n=1 Tax=Desertivirga arenae TaxID=2810309 RepID=UPI001A974D06|nr:AraC family transcriptional regulator [Pedobacter sp. SYSU D00823]
MMKRRDGFQGEKLISIPPKVWKDTLNQNNSLFQLYITHIGYFPQAKFHYRERRKGCEDNILIYCVKGKGHYIIGDRRFEVAANQFILLPASTRYMRYWADKEDPWTIYWVHYTGPDIEGMNNSLDLDILRGPMSIPLNLKAIEIWQSIYQCLEMGYSKDNLCNSSFCLYHLIASFIFPDKHSSTPYENEKDFVKNTILYMKENLGKKLNVEEMAKLNNFSNSHFSNLFRKRTGMPPMDYFIHLKMQRACQLLYKNEFKIKDLAMQLGYEDPYYFSRIFRKCMGSSPEKYRLQTRKTS